MERAAKFHRDLRCVCLAINFPLDWKNTDSNEAAISCLLMNRINGSILTKLIGLLFLENESNLQD